MSHESSRGLEVRLPAEFQPPEKIASGVWILSRWLSGWVVKRNNSANSARLSYASQLELSLAKKDAGMSIGGICLSCTLPT